MSSQLRFSRTLLALALGMASLAGTALAQQALPTGEEDAAAPAAAARSVAKSVATESTVPSLAKMTSRSAEGLKVTQRGDGTRAMDLDGQFMSVMIATPTKDGGYVVTCEEGESAMAHAKHAHDVATGKAPKTLTRATKPQPALEEK